jgi:putative flippase GtrA
VNTELVGSGARWLKFNLVGTLGIGVQLGVLALLTRAWHVGYVIATALAVEAAVFHNFVWHERFTWRDKGSRNSSEALRRFVWFDGTTGIVSIGGNLLLMRWLVGQLHIRPVHANLLSISGCSLANFLVADRCVFRESRPRHPRIFSWQRILLLTCFLVGSALGARAQDAASRSGPRTKIANFGGGFDYRLSSTRAIRAEI